MSSDTRVETSTVLFPLYNRDGRFQNVTLPFSSDQLDLFCTWFKWYIFIHPIETIFGEFFCHTEYTKSRQKIFIIFISFNIKRISEFYLGLLSPDLGEVDVTSGELLL